MPRRPVNPFPYTPRRLDLIALRPSFQRGLWLARPFRSCEDEYRDGFISIAEELLWALRGIPNPSAREKLEYDWSQRFYVINGVQPAETNFEEAVRFCHQGYMLTQWDYQFRLYDGRIGAPSRDRWGIIKPRVRFVIERFDLINVDGEFPPRQMTEEQRICMYEALGGHTRQNVSHLFSTKALSQGLQLDIDAGGGGTGTATSRADEKRFLRKVEKTLDAGMKVVQVADKFLD
jgi:hypothetical protein